MKYFIALVIIAIFVVAWFIYIARSASKMNEQIEKEIDDMIRKTKLEHGIIDEEVNDDVE